MPTTPIPSGTCWCGCAEPTGPGAHFITGHDKRAEAYLRTVEGNKSIAQKLFEAGLHPAGPRDLRQETLDVHAGYETCPRLNKYGVVCMVIGKAGMRRHVASEKAHLPLDADA